MKICKPHQLIVLIFCVCFIMVQSSNANANNKNPFEDLQHSIISGKFTAWKDINTIKDLALWYTALNTKKTVGYQTMQGLVIRHPDWPSMHSIRRLIEKKMPGYIHPEQISNWFKRFPPLTGEGLKLYTHSLMLMHKKDEANFILKKSWRTMVFSEDEIIYFSSKYKNIISKKDHRNRADHLFWAGRLQESTYLYNVLSPNDKALVMARIKLARVEKGVDAAIAAVPASLKKDEGLHYARVYWRRKKNMDKRAADLLSIEKMPKNITHNKRWWRERHILARRAIEGNDFKTAYKLTSEHHQTKGLGFAQAEFLSGFLSLRKLNKPRRAFDHFHNLHNIVKTPVSLARASYWTARAAEALDDKENAQKWYLDAAQYPTTFYGQHAVEKLGNVDISQLLQNSLPMIDNAKVKKYSQTENMRMLHLLHLAGLNKYTRPFFTRALSKAKTIPEYMAIVDMGRKTGQYHYSVFASKKLLSKQKTIVFNKGYPLLPKRWRDNFNNPDPALVHAIIRQESNFETTIKSPAGALGLMQLMPATAGETRRKLGIKRPLNGKNALTTNPAYNVKLGSKYLRDMLKRFNGSAILSIAAYNAGPNRISRWVKERGDPQKLSHDDAIDWIEMIPIYETRNYVQRVLENRFVYTYRLAPTRKYVKLSSLF